MRTFVAIAGILSVLAGCASQPQAQSQSRAAAARPLPPWPEAPGKPAPTARPAAPMRAAPVAIADPSEAVWHLRAGLNVAALMCKGRGRVSVAGDYARLLSRHRGLLASAYSGEQKRHGSGLDRHQTRLYNRYSNQRDPAGFCRSAAGVAKQAAAMDSPSLSRSAGRLVGDLD